MCNIMKGPCREGGREGGAASRVLWVLSPVCGIVVVNGIFCSQVDPVYLLDFFLAFLETVQHSMTHEAKYF